MSNSAKAASVPSGGKSAAVDRACKEVLAATAAETLYLASPLVVDHAKGCHVVDIDGREYLDLTMGFGPLFLGHAPDVVVEAVAAAAGRGLHYALPHVGQEPFARLITESVPCAERVLFCNTGTEATMYAFRAARAYSGKDRIALFEGSYHGAHDYVLTSAVQDSPLDAPEFVARKGGVTAAALSTVTMLPYWNDAAFAMIRKAKAELAAVIVEPVQGGNPQSEQGEWLSKLADVCREAGVLLIFDEIITGFRLALGGAQKWFGIKPDLATYGKVLGGGLPIGAIAGRADIMEAFVAHHSPAYAAGREAFCTGTFNGNPMSVAAGTATLRHLVANPHLYDEVNRRSDHLAASVNHFAEVEGIPAHVNHCGSVLLIHFGVQHPRTARGLRSAEAALGPAGKPLAVASREFFGRLLGRRVIIPGVHHFHLSTAHTDEDVAFAIRAITQSMKDVQQQGLC
jgi:glutamate-1-semialdehyde 2,1-aminomutase